MNNLFDGMFGKIPPEMCRLSMNGGIAVKTSNGYKTYNVEKGAFKMEGVVVYSGWINKEPLYKVINFNNGELYAVELHELSGNVMTPATDWVPGEACVALFALTEDEFFFKDTNPEELERLIQKLYENIPRDRLLSSFYVNITTKEKRECDLWRASKVYTMDNKLYEKKVGVELLTAKEKVYVIYCNETGENIPAIGWNGEVRIYAQEDWARRFVTNNNEVGLFYREITIYELKKRIIDWFAEGITKYVFGFVEEKIIDIDLETLFEADNKKLKKYHGSSLNYLMIRFRQYNTNKKSQGLVSMAQTMFSAFCHELPKTLLLVPVLYDNESQFTSNNDLGLHTTINAQKILQDINAKNFIYNHIENKDELEANEERKFVVEKDGEPIYVHMNGEKIIEFLGSDEYDVADKPGGEGCMHFCTVKSPQGELDSLPAFTNLNDLKKIYGNTVHIGLATYDDLINKINDGSALNGIVFNPGGISLFIAKDELVLVEKEMQEKPKIYIHKGLISMVCGLVSIFLFPLTSIPGLIYGILSLKETKSKNIRRDGKAVGGIITSAIGTFFLLCFIMTFIFAANDKKYDEVESYPKTTESQTYTIPKDIQESNEELREKIEEDIYENLYKVTPEEIERTKKVLEELQEMERKQMEDAKNER